MPSYVVHGEATLAGTVRVRGATTAAYALASAALLAAGRTVLHNVPSVPGLDALLTGCGASVARQGPLMVADIPETLDSALPATLAGRPHAAGGAMAALLARTGRVPLPAATSSGPLAAHVAALRGLGAQVVSAAGGAELRSPRGLVGATVTLPAPSVPLTRSVLLAAVTARGTTRIPNSAAAPEIAELVAALTAMGARIGMPCGGRHRRRTAPDEGAGRAARPDARGTDQHAHGAHELIVHGVEALHSATHRLPGSRLVAGVHAAAAAATGGDVTIEGVAPDGLTMVLDRLRAAGVDVLCGDTYLRVLPARRLRPTDVLAGPYPDVPPQLQAMFVVLLSQASGASRVTARGGPPCAIVDQARRLGMDVRLEGRHALVRGKCRLAGNAVRAADARAGVALILAGLVATGETLVVAPAAAHAGCGPFAADLAALGARVGTDSAPVGAASGGGP